MGTLGIDSLVVVLDAEKMIDVYGHKEQRRCKESLRLIGGGSPGSRDTRRIR